MSGFTAASIAVSGGGAVYNFTSAGDGATYSFAVRPDSGSATTLTISVSPGVVLTSMGGPNLAASLSLFYDPAPLAPVIRTNATKLATAELYIAFAVDFGEVGWGRGPRGLTARRETHPSSLCLIFVRTSPSFGALRCPNVP